MAVRIRRASTLVLTLEGASVAGCNFYARRSAPLSPLAIELLAGLADWRDPAELFTGVAPAARAARSAELLGLLDLGFAVVEGTDAAAIDQRLAHEWVWGPTAGYYHFGIKDTSYEGPSYAYQFLTHRVATTPQVPLYTANPPDALRLPAPPLDGPIGLMRARRSYRGFDPQRPLPLAALRDCLYAGFAITGFADTGIPGAQYLPLTLTPSGGGRNPFEAYVVARAVDGLAPGVYHYAGLDNSLAPVRPSDSTGTTGTAPDFAPVRLPDTTGTAPVRPPDTALPTLSSLLGNQDWFADAAAIIFLVAHFDRCAWKYPHPTGFRVVLLEAGHIAQNLLLAATHHGLAAAPTCAISDAAIEALCGLDRVRQAAVHSVALGLRAAQPSSVDLQVIHDNAQLPR